jgi:Tol biopolymer transport system component
MKRLICAAVAAASTLVAPLATAALPEARRLHSIDVFQLELADDIQISPDGSKIVYVRVSYDIMSDRPRRNLWMVNSDGTNNRPLRSEAKNFMSPRWSPDGTRLAYVSAAEGSPQLYVRWMDSGQTALLTNLVEGPDAITWSPDGRSIAFTQLVHADKKPLATPPPKPEGAQWAPPVKVVDSVIYRADGAGWLEPGFTHIFIVSADGGAPRQLTDGDFNDDGPLSFTPDGKKIVFAANRGADWERNPQNNEVFSVDVATQQLTQLTQRAGPDNSPVVSPDGRKIAYLGFDDRFQGYQVTHLYVMAADGSDSRLVTGAFDRDVENPRWSADGRGLYFSFDERGAKKLGYVTLDGKVRNVAENLGGTDLGRPYTSGGFSVARNGRVAYPVNSPERPADVATATLGGGARRLKARCVRSTGRAPSTSATSRAG